MNRNINVFAPVVVVAQGEAFNWVAQPAQSPNGPISVAPAGTWPLGTSPFTVTPGTPLPVHVPANAACGTYTFACTPVDPNVASQTLYVIAHAPSDPCDGATAEAGGYFVWVNDDADAAFIAPDPSNSNYWPLPSDQYVVPPNDWLVLRIPDGATPGGYPLVISKPRGVGRCPQMGQPKLNVGGTEPGRSKR